jgi:hypothetical protein
VRKFSAAGLAKAASIAQGAWQKRREQRIANGVHEHLLGFMKQRLRLGESLREFLQALTRYSANDPELPVNDPPLFTGCSLA